MDPDPFPPPSSSAFNIAAIARFDDSHLNLSSVRLPTRFFKLHQQLQYLLLAHQAGQFSKQLVRIPLHLPIPPCLNRDGSNLLGRVVLLIAASQLVPGLLRHRRCKWIGIIADLTHLPVVGRNLSFSA